MRLGLWFSPVLLALLGCGEDAVALNGAGGGGSIPKATGSLACALTGCEIARLPLATNMPTGSATYLGRASYEAINGAGNTVVTTANLQINANFSGRSLTLQLSNFNDGTAYSGTAQGSASISGPLIAGSYAGNLTSTAGTKSVSGTLSGQFRGTGAVALDGDLVASGAVNGVDAYGRFFANKQ